MICVINNKLLVVATRDKFRIVQYQYTSDVPKSRFYQQFHHEKGDRLNFVDVYCSSNTHYTENKATVEQNVSYHSVTAARCNDDTYHLLFGGNDCVAPFHKENLCVSAESYKWGVFFNQVGRNCDQFEDDFSSAR